MASIETRTERTDMTGTSEDTQPSGTTRAPIIALVPPDDIERIVGTQRKHGYHVGRAVSAEQTVYILHSHECRDSGRDLRDCPFSIALAKGINERDWSGMEDGPVMLDITSRGDLVPTGRMIGVAR